VDADSGLVHTVKGTAGNVNDVVEANALLHGQEAEVFGDAGDPRVPTSAPMCRPTCERGVRRRSAHGDLAVASFEIVAIDPAGAAAWAPALVRDPASQVAIRRRDEDATEPDQPAPTQTASG
jgi:hypothetical protein